MSRATQNVRNCLEGGRGKNWKKIGKNQKKIGKNRKKIEKKSEKNQKIGAHSG